MFYILTNKFEDIEQDALVEGNCDFLKDFPFNFEEGLPIKHRLPDREIVIDSFVNTIRGRMTDNLNISEFTGAFFSLKFKRFFEEHSKSHNIEFIPIKILDRFSNLLEVKIEEMKRFASLSNEEVEYETITYDNYFIANVVNLIDCIDHEQSDLEYYIPKIPIRDDMPENMKQVLLEQSNDNSIDFINSLVFNKGKIPALDFFRLKDCPRILVCSEKIVNLIKENGLTGFVFEAIEEYTEILPETEDYENQNKIEVLKDPTNMELKAQRIAAFKKEREEAYQQMQERIRKRREAGEGSSLII